MDFSLPIGVVSNCIFKMLENAKKDNDFRSLFISTGDFLSGFEVDSDELASQLKVAFSKESMAELAKKANSMSGFNLADNLEAMVISVLMSCGIQQPEATTYSKHFVNRVLSYIKEKDPDKYTQLFLGEFREEVKGLFGKTLEEMNSINESVCGLKADKPHALTIDEIDARLKMQTLNPSIGIDFFEIDDESFSQEFRQSLNKEIINVIGNCQEETLYRILHELKENKEEKRPVYIIEDKESWDILRKKAVSGSILFPFFYCDSIVSIPDNTNIFIFSNEETCYSQDKIELRRRTRKNIVESLEKAGLEHASAYKLVEETNGLYLSMKRRLYKGKSLVPPPWKSLSNNILTTALLCGSWDDSDGDKKIIEKLSGCSYRDFMEAIKSHELDDEPFVITINSMVRGIHYTLASNVNAWNELDKFISKEQWDTFVDLLYDVLIESEPLFEYPFKDHWRATVYSGKSVWSQSLKKGMIQTLIMRACYSVHKENQLQIDGVICRILNTITDKKRWAYISQYIVDLCEASPESVLAKLEEEFLKPSGLSELFEEKEDDRFSARHYYVNVLWAVEQLLKQKAYVVRAINWLWKINECGFHYAISNSPKGTLEDVFCAWTNISVLTCEEKIHLAQAAIGKYKEAWDIFYKNLPGEHSTICVSQSVPSYRLIDDVEEVTTESLRFTYTKYYELCFQEAKDDPYRWCKLIQKISYFGEGIIKRFFGSLTKQSESWTDENKVKIKDSIRDEIYRHRFYQSASWALNEKKLSYFVNGFESIKCQNPLYDYLYIFQSKYEFPLLDPVAYDTDGYMEKNKEHRKATIRNEMSRFLKEGHNICDLVKLAHEQKRKFIGEIVGKYYGKGFDESVFDTFFRLNDASEACAYTSSCYRTGKIEYDEVLRICKNKDVSADFLASVIRWSDTEKGLALLETESEEVKEAYWSKIIDVEGLNQETALAAIQNCFSYGTLENYFFLLFRTKDSLEPDQLYESFIKAPQVHNQKLSSTAQYYLKELLRIVSDLFIGDEERCSSIAKLENLFARILDCDDMRCTKKLMQRHPKLYAELIRYIFKSDDGADFDGKLEPNQREKLFSLYYTMHFCPCENNGAVIYENIKEWVENFYRCLMQQCQASLFGHLLGKLLAYSPSDKEDGYFPCKSVRQIIEENWSEDLKDSFIVEEENKRGVYSPDAGKGEEALALRYKHNADIMRVDYPHTASIFDQLYSEYMYASSVERKRAEDEYK